LCSSIASISKEYRESAFELFCKLRSMEKNKFLPFPNVEDAWDPPVVPYNDDFIVDLGIDSVEIVEPVVPKAPSIKKLDIKVNVKATGAPIKAKGGNKPKKSGLFGSFILGFWIIVVKNIIYLIYNAYQTFKNKANIKKIISIGNIIFTLAFVYFIWITHNRMISI
jgi:hypothetical protein